MSLPWSLRLTSLAITDAPLPLRGCRRREGTRTLGTNRSSVRERVVPRLFYSNHAHRMKDTLRDQYRARSRRLREMGVRTYKEYLKTPEWRAFKRRIAEDGRIEWSRCRICDTEDGLIIHHKTYKRLGRRFEPGDFVALCRPCHNECHAYHRAHPTVSLKQIVKRVMKRRERLLKKPTPMIDRLLASPRSTESISPRRFKYELPGFGYQP